MAWVFNAGDEFMEDAFALGSLIDTGAANVGLRVRSGRDRAVADAYGFEDGVPHGHGFVVSEGGVDGFW